MLLQNFGTKPSVILHNGAVHRMRNKPSRLVQNYVGVTAESALLGRRRQRMELVNLILQGEYAGRFDLGGAGCFCLGRFGSWNRRCVRRGQPIIALIRGWPQAGSLLLKRCKIDS